MSDQKYRLTYSFECHPKGVERAAIPEGHGGCDAALIISMIYPPDGSFSMVPIGVDGRKDDVLDDA